MKINKHTIFGIMISCLLLTACGGSTPTTSLPPSIDEPTTSNPSIEDKDYKFKVESIGGKLLENVAVEIYDSNGELVSSKLTNSIGEVNTTLKEGEYSIELPNLVSCYYYDEPFKTQENIYEYKLQVKSCVPNELMDLNTFYEIKDVMYNFEIEDCEGNLYSLKNEIDTHELVVLNFWNTTCSYCLQEFPVIDEAFVEYQDKVSLFALSNINDNQTIKELQDDWNYSFRLGSDPSKFDGQTSMLYDAFSCEGTPTTVIIDRYGIVSYIESGAILEANTFKKLFDLFLGDDYIPYTNNPNRVEETTPNVTQPSSSEIEALINSSEVVCTYTESTNEVDEPRWKWPWLINEDEKAIYPGNTGINGTSAVIETNITIPENKVLAFDYKSQTELDYDILYVIVDGIIIHEISGVMDNYETCYVYVSTETKEYNLVLLYLKDDYSFEGDDLVYIKNMRFLNEEEIKTPLYIYRYCATGEVDLLGNYENYVNLVYNENDKYYHVESVDGPLVMANLTHSTQWNYYSISNLTELGYGFEYTDLLNKFFTYCNNGDNGYTPVTIELKEALTKLMQYVANSKNPNEWMEICGYFDPYGPNTPQVEDPIKGLAPFSAFEAKLDEINEVTYEKIFVPRGYKFHINVETSGVYKIKAISDSTNIEGVNAKKETICWVFDENDELINESNNFARKYRFDEESAAEFELFQYFEKGKDYYIAPGYYNVEELGTFQFTVSYEAETYELLTACSPDYYTTTLDEYGNMDQIIAGGINVKLNEEDGYYYELKDDGTLGSLVYLDLYYPPLIVNISIKEMIEKGIFDFTSYGGKNYTFTARQTLASANQDESSELYGTSLVTQQVAEMLQAWMDVYSFSGIKDSWTKLCYYYQIIGE